jgi:hypothetical protein
LGNAADGNSHRCRNPQRGMTRANNTLSFCFRKYISFPTNTI